MADPRFPEDFGRHTELPPGAVTDPFSLGIRLGMRDEPCANSSGSTVLSTLPKAFSVSALVCMRSRRFSGLVSDFNFESMVESFLLQARLGHRPPAFCCLRRRDKP